MYNRVRNVFNMGNIAHYEKEAQYVGDSEDDRKQTFIALLDFAIHKLAVAVSLFLLENFLISGTNELTLTRLLLYSGYILQAIFLKRIYLLKERSPSFAARYLRPVVKEYGSTILVMGLTVIATETVLASLDDK